MLLLIKTIHSAIGYSCTILMLECDSPWGTYYGRRCTISGLWWLARIIRLVMDLSREIIATYLSPRLYVIKHHIDKVPGIIMTLTFIKVPPKITVFLFNFLFLYRFLPWLFSEKVLTKLQVIILGFNLGITCRVFLTPLEGLVPVPFHYFLNLRGVLVSWLLRNGSWPFDPDGFRRHLVVWFATVTVSISSHGMSFAALWKASISCVSLNVDGIFVGMLAYWAAGGVYQVRSLFVFWVCF